MKQNQKQKEPKYRCSVCGDEFRRKSNAFTPTRSMLYKGNGGLLTICKTCVGEIYTKYLEKFEGNECRAIKRMCMLLDIYFCDSLFEASNNSNQSNRMNAYLSKINLVPYINKTFDDYLFSGSYEDLNTEETPETKARKISSKYIKVWGYGFTYEEYQFLEGKFSEWKSKVIIDSMARESLVRDLCVIKLQQQKAIQSGDVDLWGRLQKTFQDTLSSANLKPIQAENDEKTAEKPLGVMIEMFENEDPIPEVNPEWKDIDGIVKLFNIYFLGHLSKMLGIKNRYSKDYEEEMQKYRAEIDDIKDSPDEDVFEYLSENGFTESEKQNE